MLHALGHPQPPTPVRTDNSTATSFANSTYTPKRSKSWDMRYHWLQDRTKSKDFHIYWDKGSRNRADYSTKHFPPSYHQEQRPNYILKGYLLLQKMKNVNKKCSCLRGCVYHTGLVQNLDPYTITDGQTIQSFTHTYDNYPLHLRST